MKLGDVFGVAFIKMSLNLHFLQLTQEQEFQLVSVLVADSEGWFEYKYICLQALDLSAHLVLVH